MKIRPSSNSLKSSDQAGGTQRPDRLATFKGPGQTVCAPLRGACGVFMGFRLIVILY